MTERQKSLYEQWMRTALAEAELAFNEAEVPVGAAVYLDDQLIARNHNRREQRQDPTAHAEMLVLTEAARNIGSWRLERCVLVVTLEPCPMCAGTILQSRVPEVVFGATDPKAGAVVSLFTILTDNRLNHTCRVEAGILAEECGEILTRFFRQQRKYKTTQKMRGQ